MKLNRCRWFTLLLAVVCLLSMVFPSTLLAEETEPRSQGTVEVSSEDQTDILNSLSFFVGKVQRAYNDTASSVEAPFDLSQYIDTENKTIESVTGELNWDYDKGIMTIDTLKTQGAVGFLSKKTAIDLGDVIISSNNEYATVMVSSLDGNPIASSGKIMIQAMTEEKYYGAETVDIIKNNQIVKQIKNLGSAPLNVKNIDVTVTFKNKTSGSTIVALDENGYPKGELTAEQVGSDLKITLAPDAVYTVITDSEVDWESPYPTAAEAGYVWWEGENPIETNYPEVSHFDITTEGKWHLLSEGNWLTSDNYNVEPGTELFAKYSIEVPADAEYNFWVRKFWKHGPFRWRFDDDEEWSIVGKDVALADNVEFRTFICANWVNLGKVYLTEGEHTFEFRLLTGEGYDFVSGFDCFMLTTEAFVPRGHLKPGEKTGLAEEGYWNFEPAGDPFKESALMDLSFLNEDVAGQEGYVRREGEGFVLGDGTPVKFWAVNATKDQDHKTIDYLAQRLAKFGVNMARVHGALFDSNDLRKIDETQLERLHYFVYAMKQQGIYTNISFYFPLWVNIKPEDGIEGYETISNKQPFALLQFDPEFQEIYKGWAEQIFLSENPYTGIPLAQDPAVAIIEVQNEDNYFFHTFKRSNIPEVQMNKLETIFGTWLTDKYGSLEAALAAWGAGSGLPNDNIAEGRMELKDAWFMSADGIATGQVARKRMSDQVEFLTWHQKKFYEDMVEFYRTEIGTESMISASNWTTADTRILDALERYTYTATDVIDRHGYFECSHSGDDGAAGYSVRVGHTYKDTTVMMTPQSSITPVIQTENYPHMITETAWTNPSKYHGESVPMWSTYGALQGMDAIHLFSVGTADWEASPAKWPVMVPSVLGQFPAFALMYRRGDVAEAPVVLKLNHSMADLYDFQGSPVYERQALDLIRMPSEPSPEPPVVGGEDKTLYNFETNALNGFKKIGGTGTASLSRSVLRKYGGESSMKVAFIGEVHIGLQDVEDIPAGSTVRFRIYVPSAVDADIAAVVDANGDGPYNENYVSAETVEKDKWIELAVEYEGENPADFVGVKIIPQGTQFGEIWIDSITFDGYEDTLVQPPVVPGPDASLFNFENGNLHGFKQTGREGVATFEIDTYKKYKGESSLKVSFNGPVQVGVNTPFDIPTGSVLKIRMYCPSSTVTSFQPMLFGNSWGVNNVIFKGPSDYPKDEWVEFELSYDWPSPSVGLLINLSPAQDAPEGVIWLDAISYDDNAIPEEPPVVEGPDTALYNFENGELHGFTQVAGPGTATVTNDTARKYCGNGSAKVEFSGGSVQLGIQRDITDIPVGSTVIFRMYVPQGVVIDLQPVVFGSDAEGGWVYNGDYRADQWLTKDGWNEMRVTFANGGLPIKKVGLNINVPEGGTPEGTIWIDSIAFEDTAAPVITLDQTGGTVETAEFTVSGSVNEACTVKVNGTEVALDENLTFTTTITLAEGANTITVEARDASGNTSSESIEVVYNAAQPEIGIAFDKQIVRAGRVAYVTIGVKNAASLKGFDVTLDYDADLFDLVEISAHADFGIQGEDAYIDSSVSGGSIHVIGVKLGDGAVDGDASLITLTFNAKQAVNGIGEFNIADGAEISNSNAELLALDGIDSSLVVADPDTVKDAHNAVKINDLTAVAACFMAEQTDDDYVADYDMDKDGIIDLFDIVYVATHILNDPLN